MGVEETIRDAFTRAAITRRHGTKYKSAVAKGNKNIMPPRRDLQLEPLVEILEGKRYVHAHCYIASEIPDAISVLRTSLDSRSRLSNTCLEGYKVAKEIAAHGAGASTFADIMGYKIEAYDAIPYNMAIMTRAAVVVSVNSDSDERARRLNIEAQRRCTGRSDRGTGTQAHHSQPGDPTRYSRSRGFNRSRRRMPTSAIWNAHPLVFMRESTQRFVDGDVFFDRQQDLSRRADLAKERARRSSRQILIARPHVVLLHKRQVDVVQVVTKTTTSGKESDREETRNWRREDWEKR
jgi:hypothetical protein